MNSWAPVIHHPSGRLNPIEMEKRGQELDQLSPPSAGGAPRQGSSSGVCKSHAGLHQCQSSPCGLRGLHVAAFRFRSTQTIHTAALCPFSTGRHSISGRRIATPFAQRLEWSEAGGIRVRTLPLFHRPVVGDGCDPLVSAAWLCRGIWGCKSRIDLGRELRGAAGLIGNSLCFRLPTCNPAPGCFGTCSLAS